MSDRERRRRLERDKGEKRWLLGGRKTESGITGRKERCKEQKIRKIQKVRCKCVWKEGEGKMMDCSVSYSSGFERKGGNLKWRIRLSPLAILLLSNEPSVSSVISFSPSSILPLLLFFSPFLPCFWLSGFHFLIHIWNLHLDEAHNVAGIWCICRDPFRADSD